PKTSPRLRWPAAAWAEWPSKPSTLSPRRGLGGSSIRRIGRAGGAIRRPFFIGDVIEHRVGVVELRGLLGCRRRRLPVMAGGSDQEDANDQLSHSGKLSLRAAIKKGPPRGGPSLPASRRSLTCSQSRSCRRPARSRRRFSSPPRHSERRSA